VQPIIKTFSLETQTLNGQEPVVTVDKLPAGVYRVETRALDRVNGSVLFQATREMTAKPTSALASVKTAMQSLVLDRSKGDINIEVPSVQSTDPLIYINEVKL
jgi:hypothetical protein